MAVQSDTGVLTREQMQEILQKRIWRAHRMTVDEYFEARACGTIELGPVDASIEVFAGECAAVLPPAREN